MKLKKWLSALTAGVLLSTTFAFASSASAEDKAKTIADESIYDLLVDRFFNGTGKNDDEQVNAKDPEMFAGGDFDGLVKKVDYISKMGYTIVSVGSVLETEKYDGSMVTSYTTLEPHFGTEEEFQHMLNTYQNKKIKIMVDFPLSNVSPNHEWASEPGFVASTNDGKIQWDLTNTAVQDKLIESASQFVAKFGVN
ncbi:MAG TPA: alpha-amylase family protein, partial [Solibacillus sp.]